MWLFQNLKLCYLGLTDYTFTTAKNKNVAVTMKLSKKKRTRNNNTNYEYQAHCTEQNTRKEQTFTAHRPRYNHFTHQTLHLTYQNIHLKFSKLTFEGVYLNVISNYRSNGECPIIQCWVLVGYWNWIKTFHPSC